LSHVGQSDADYAPEPTGPIAGGPSCIDALNTGVRGGPDPASVTLEAFGRDIPEA